MVTSGDGGIRWCMFPKCFFQNGVNFLRRLALQEKKKLDNSSRFHVFNVELVCVRACVFGSL